MKKRKLTAILLSLALFAALTLSGTLAFLIDGDNNVDNTFEPGRVSCKVNENFDGKVKSNVAVKNTGNVKAYIRAAVVVTWQDEDGNIYPKAPVETEDYTINYKTDEQIAQDADNFTSGQWIQVGDYYYWNQPVLSVDENSSKCSTGILITECKPVENRAPDGYHLVVDVLASAIQADGVNAQNEKAVKDAWGVDPAALGAGN